MKDKPKVRLEYCKYDPSADVMVSMSSSPIDKGSTNIPLTIDLVVNKNIGNENIIDHIKLGPSELARIGWWLRDMYKGEKE